MYIKKLCKLLYAQQSGSGERDYGRIEICLSESWGTICDHFWENQDASVACRQLGFSEYGKKSLFISMLAVSLQAWYIGLHACSIALTVRSLDYATVATGKFEVHRCSCAPAYPIKTYDNT